MRANVEGRIRNTYLPKAHPLLPLFEAVTNSIDAIEDANLKPNEGQIDILVLRQATLPLLQAKEPEQKFRSPIRGFEIQDNGVGFTDANYEAFNEADTQVKANRGGRGIGRFVWLKAFEKVAIDSTFRQNGRTLKRAFEFAPEAPDGIRNLTLSAASGADERRTIVRLVGFRDEYEKQAPRVATTIAQRLLEHFLEYYVLTKMPRVIVRDEEESEPIALDQLYERLVAHTQHTTVRVRGNDFDIGHFFLHTTSGLSHQINYCANRRVVVSERLATKIPNLPPTVFREKEGDEFVYAAYVSSSYLDSHVSEQRTSFHAMPEDSQLFPDELSWSELEAATLSEIRQALAPYTEAIRIEKAKRIQEFVNKQAPEYRHIVKNHPDRLDEIPPDLPDNTLAVRLYEIQRDIETQLRAKAGELLDEARPLEEEMPSEETLQKLSKFWQEFNEVGKANLAKYIVHRKYMLSFLEKALKRKGDGKYTREEIVHQVIFPVKSTSDDVAFDQHNLWIIDEKLAYHRYLASDLPLSRIEAIKSKSLLRPDLLIFFDSPFAVVDSETPYHSGIVIFEFKRPMRDDYSEDEDPIRQVYRYIGEIKRGQKTDKDGRPFRASETTPFYCYIIADLTERLKEQAEHANLRLTPDGSGYFGYNESIGAYVEIMDFDKMIQDSKKRNRVLFEKLSLPDKLF